MRIDVLNYTCLGFVTLNWAECIYLHSIGLKWFEPGEITVVFLEIYVS